MQTFDLLLFVYGFKWPNVSSWFMSIPAKSVLAANNNTQHSLQAYKVKDGLPKQQLFWKFFVDHSFIIVWEHL